MASETRFLNKIKVDYSEDTFNVREGDVCITFTEQGIFTIAPDIDKPNYKITNHTLLALAIVKLLLEDDEQFNTIVSEAMDDIIKKTCVPTKPI